MPITKTQKIKISRMIDGGINQRDIAAKYGISVSYVKKIRQEVKSQDLEEESIWDRWDNLTRPYWRDLWEIWDKGIQEFKGKVVACAKERERLRRLSRHQEAMDKSRQYRMLMQQIGGQK